MFIEIVLGTFKVSLSEVQGPRGGVWGAGGDRKHTCSRGCSSVTPDGELALGKFKAAAPEGPSQCWPGLPGDPEV